MYTTQNAQVTEDEARAYALQLFYAPTVPMVLTTAVQLGLLEILATVENGGGFTAAEMATCLSATQNPTGTADMLDRMLHLLAIFSVVTCTVRERGDGAVERVYGIAPAGRFFVKGDCSEGSLATVLEFNTSRYAMECWYHFKEAVLEGGRTTTFEKAHGKSLFEFMNIDPELNKLFNQSMEGMTKVITKQVLEVYKGFEGIRVLVDVGGGVGAFLSSVVSMYPTIHGINFDLPHVVETASYYLGVEHVGGDMFEKIPNGDAILIKGVLHNWDDEHCMKILKRCHEALLETGKVIIVEAILPDGMDTTNRAKFAVQQDIAMVAGLRGKERTLNEFKAISQAIGFKSIHIVCSVNVVSVIELLK